MAWIQGQIDHSPERSSNILYQNKYLKTNAYHVYPIRPLPHGRGGPSAPKFTLGLAIILGAARAGPLAIVTLVGALLLKRKLRSLGSLALVMW